VEGLNLEAMQLLGKGQFAGCLKLLRQAEALTVPSGADGSRRTARDRTAALLRAATLNNLGILYKQ
jgi:hypothetical protein